MRKLYAIGAIVVLMAGCQGGGDDAADPEPAATPAPSPDAAAPAAGGAAITSAVTGSADHSGISGQAQVTPSADGLTLTLNLTGAPAGPHAWHIHQAACGVSGAPIVVALSEKPNQPAVVGELQVAADGSANATANIPASMLTLDQLRTGDYALHVHRTGGAEHGPSIACATL